MDMLLVITLSDAFIGGVMSWQNAAYTPKGVSDSLF